MNRRRVYSAESETLEAVRSPHSGTAGILSSLCMGTTNPTATTQAHEREGTVMKTATNRRSAAKRTSAPRHLEVGSQLFHNGFPVQLLYRIAQEARHETWRVRPLFVEGPDRTERFQLSDCVSYLHTMRAPARANTFGRVLQPAASWAD